MDTITVSLAENEVLLDRLLDQGIAIAHDCGGALACSTCHVIIHSPIAPASEDELDMLERGGVDAPGARLACQVSGAAELVVEVPKQDAPVHERTFPLTVTGGAAKYLAQQLEKHPGAVAVRLGVEPAGCSGFGYRVDVAEALNQDDKVYEMQGIRLVVDAKSLPFVQGTTIDLVKEGLARRLRFDNPNARQSCGCGESFGV